MSILFVFQSAETVTLCSLLRLTRQCDIDTSDSVTLCCDYYLCSNFSDTVSVTVTLAL